MNILKQFRKPYFSILLASLILFVSCEQYNNGITDNVKTHQLTGKELFKAIFFAEGDIAKKLPNFKNFEKVKSQLTSEQEKSFSKFQIDLINQIDKSNPEYFKNLEGAVYTRNPVIIRNELESSNKIIKEATQELIDFNYDEIEKEIFQQKSNLVVNLDDIQNLKSEQFLKNYQPQYGQRYAYLQAQSIRVDSFGWYIGPAYVIVAAVAVVIAVFLWSQVPPDDDGRLLRGGDESADDEFIDLLADFLADVD